MPDAGILSIGNGLTVGVVIVLIAYAGVREVWVWGGAHRQMRTDFESALARQKAECADERDRADRRITALEGKYDELLERILSTQSLAERATDVAEAKVRGRR